MDVAGITRRPPWRFRSLAWIALLALLAIEVIENGAQPCDRVHLLGGRLDPLHDHLKPREIGLLFHPDVFACLRVGHLLLEPVLLAQGHGDSRGAEFALESQLVDQSLEGVTDSPAAGIASGVAAGAGLPGRTEVLKSRRRVWICHLGPFPVHASDACTWSTRCEDGRQPGRRQPPSSPMAWQQRACAGLAVHWIPDVSSVRWGKKPAWDSS